MKTINAMTDPLFHPGWIRFNEMQWGLNAEKTTLGPEKGDGWQLETVLYRNKRGLFVDPPRNPYLPVRFESTKNQSYSLNRRQRLGFQMLAELLKKNGTKHGLTFSAALQDVRPFLWLGMRAEPKFTYVLALENWHSLVDPSVLNRIRKAQSLGYRCEATTNYAEVCECLKAAEERKHFDLKVSAHELQLAAQQMGENLVCFLLKGPDGDNKGAAIRLYCQDGRALGWSTGIKTEALRDGGNSILYGFILDYFHEKGCTTMDLVGANIPSVGLMKEPWGGDLTTYYTIRPYEWQDIARGAIQVARTWLRK